MTRGVMSPRLHGRSVLRSPECLCLRTLLRVFADLTGNFHAEDVDGAAEGRWRVPIWST